MMWTDSVTEAEWTEWTKIARRASNQRQAYPSLGAEDYAAAAIEKLLQQQVRPDNVEAWIRTVLRHMYIDRARKIVRHEFGNVADIDNEHVEREMFSFAMGPSTRAIQLDEVRRILNILSSKEQQLLILSAAGVDNHEIALELGYATNKIVATRIGQIATKLRVAFQN